MSSFIRYTHGCEALGVEVLGLPYGYATRLLQEFRQSSRGGGGSGGSGSGGGGGGGGGSGSSGKVDLGGGFSLSVGALSTTFSGAISLDSTPRSTLHTRPLTSAAQLRLHGAAAALSQPLSAIVRAADTAADAIARALLPSGSGGRGGGEERGVPWTDTEMSAAAASLQRLLEGSMDVAEGEAILVRCMRLIAAN